MFNVQYNFNKNCSKDPGRKKLDIADNSRVSYLLAHLEFFRTFFFISGGGEGKVCSVRMKIDYPSTVMLGHCIAFFIERRILTSR